MSAAPTERDPLPNDSRYEVLAKIASGGMASVYVGRLRGAAGFWRLVAIKRAHAFLAEDPTFRKMLVAEARVASRIHHPNIVAVQDVEELAHELLLVMDYIEGAALSELETLAGSGGAALSPGVVVRIALDACAGLHAAHELRDEAGVPLHLVHRDVSPQNVLVGLDGVTRIADFGIAKVALGGSSATTTGALKGKVAYMSPEYIEGDELDARSDVFALGVVVWEALTGQRLFRASTEIETMRRVVEAPVQAPSKVLPGLGTWLDAPVLSALEKSRVRRYGSAHAFAAALEAAARSRGSIATYTEVAAEVQRLVGKDLELRRAMIRDRVAGGGRRRLGQPAVANDAKDDAEAGPGSEDSGIRVSYTDTAGLGDPAVLPPEASTLGSSVSSRLVRTAAADTARARRIRTVAGVAALAAATAGAGVLIGRASGPSAASPSAHPSFAPPLESASADGAPAAAEPLGAVSAPLATASAATPSNAGRIAPRSTKPPPPGVASSKAAVESPTAAPSASLGRPGPNPYAAPR